MAGVQFQRIAFHRAFGKAEHDNEFGVMAEISTTELQAIRKMMGANSPVDPFPLTPASRNTYLTPDELDSLISKPKDE
jgi:hypothetical protein